MNKYKKNIGKFIFIVVICLIVFIGYFIFNKSRENYNYLKIDKSKNLVYTESKTQHGNYNQYKPYVNIKGELGTAINENISEYIEFFNNDNICITYDTDLNGKVLSLVIKVEDYSYAEYAAILYFRSYNIKLDTLELLSNEKLLSYFEVDEAYVQSKLNEKIEEYYNTLVNNNSISNCNYNCFLKSRDFTDTMDDVEYYVRDGKLVVFKPYTYMYNAEEEKNIVYDFLIETE